MKFILINFLVFFFEKTLRKSDGLIIDSQFQNMNKIFDNYFEDLILNNFLENILISDGIETLCLKEIQRVFEGLKNKEIWAITMLDASAKIQSGLLYGNIVHFGNYDECIGINEGSSMKNQIKGKYCTAILTLSGSNGQTQGKELDMLFMPTFSFCVPSGCSSREVQNVTNKILSDNQFPIRAIISEKLCSTDETPIEIPTRSIVAITIFALFGVVILIATFVEVFKFWDNPFLRCFSFYTNGKKLLISKPSEDSLNCLNGIRVISMMLVLLGHRFLASLRMPSINKIYVEEWRNYWYNYIFIGLGFAVDTFFTVSGLLVVYLYFRTVEKGRKMHWGVFYLHRFLRLTPSLLMVVLFYSTMIQFVEQQPYPILDDIFGETCRKYWWTTVLYIQNYWNPNDMCAVQAWYLAIDTHLYILSPFLLLALKKSPLRAICGVLVLSIVSMGAAFVLTFQYSLGATFLEQGLEEYRKLYTPTHIRMPPWLFGAFTGYFIAKHKDKSAFLLNKYLVFFLWILSVGSLTFVLLIQQNYNNVDYNVFAAASFNAFARPIWGAAICLIVLLCVFGHGGMINSFLSCNFFNVLIRINYSIYLIHMMVMIAIVAKFRTPVYVSNFSTIHDAIGDYCVVVFVATFWTLAFESPIIALEKMLFSEGEYGRKKYVLNLKDQELKNSFDTVIIAK